MKILFLCDEYPPGKTGGIGTAVQNLARKLAEQGHKVWCFGLYPDDYGGADQELDQGVAVQRFRYPRNLGGPLARKIIRHIPNALRGTFAPYRAYGRYLQAVRSLVATEKIDIVEMPDWNTYVYDLGIETPLPKLSVPVSVKLHCSRTYMDFETGKPIRKKWFRTDRSIFTRADAVAAVSDYIGTRTNELFQTQRPFDVIYNLVGTIDEDHNTQRMEHTVLFAGTIAEHKGIGTLFKAWNEVIKIQPKAKLLVAGKGDPQPFLGLLTHPETVHFTGHLHKQELFELFRQATLTALPSFTESFGMVAVEAIYCGCPVIFTEKGAGPEIIKNRTTGLLTDPSNPIELAEQICALLENKSERERLAANALRDIRERMSEDHIVKNQIIHYQQAIQHFRRK